MECRHLNGNPADNRLLNICWGTKRQNADDSKRLNRYKQGQDHHWGKITDDDVREIRAKYAAGWYYMHEIAAEYGISISNVHAITHRRTWTHLD